MSAPSAAIWFTGHMVDASAIDSNLVNPINNGAAGMIGEANTATTVTLSGAAGTNFASAAAVTFTLAVQRRVKITVLAVFSLGTTTNGGFSVQPAYSVGGSANVGAMTTIGRAARQPNMTGATAIAWGSSATCSATVLLAAGTYTAFGACQRTVGGSTSDTAGPFEVLVEDLGSS